MIRFVVAIVVVAGCGSNKPCRDDGNSCACSAEGFGGDSAIAECSAATAGGYCCAAQGYPSGNTLCACTTGVCVVDGNGFCDCDSAVGMGAIGSNEMLVDACPTGPNITCCRDHSGEAGAFGATYCSCYEGQSCGANEEQVANCTTTNVTCTGTAMEVDNCDPSAFGSSSSGCFYPNWESDCASANDCDPGLVCTNIGGNMRCHGVECTSDADCHNTYGSLKKDGLTYCASTCGNDGLCHF